MRRLIYIVLFFACVTGYGQPLNFIDVDTLTYNQYLREEWKPLIRSGKTALENNIDYYYLHMRIAYAYFSLEKYRSAIVYYKNALEFNEFDPVAREYLYYCYSFSGRRNDALFRSLELTASQMEAMGIDTSGKVISAGVNHAYSFSDITLIRDAFASGITSTVDGVQKAVVFLHAPRLNLAHRAGKRVVINHLASYIYRNEISYVVSQGAAFFSNEQPVSQLEYRIDTEITAAEGFIITPAVHYLYTRIPVYPASSYGLSGGRERPAAYKIELQDWVGSIMIEKQERFADLALSFTYHTFNDTETGQLGVHATAYPLANLNLYLSADIYGQLFKSGEKSGSAYLFKPLIGFKLFDNLWVELSGSLPESYNFYDVRNGIAYNTIEKIANSFEAYGIIPLYNSGLQLVFGYQYKTMNSYFFPLENKLDPFNKLSYNAHLLTGGIKWNVR